MFFHKDTIERFSCLSSCRFHFRFLFSAILPFRHGVGIGAINEFCMALWQRDAYGIEGLAHHGFSSLAMYRTANPEEGRYR